MKRLILILGAMFLVFSLSAQRQVDSLSQYHRSSLYSILIKHSQLPYGEAIDSAFMIMPVPDKFNDHNLAVRSFESSAKKVKKAADNKKKDIQNTSDIQAFFEAESTAKGIVSKWFNRDAATGLCNMDLISERGFYDASQLDIRLAEQSTRGKAQLADAGDKLIGNTYVLVNDITFVDRGEVSQGVGTGLRVLGLLAGAILGTDVSDLTDATASMVENIDGFKVNITSYLYRLAWNEDLLWDFYSRFYADENYSESDRVANRDRFNAIAGNDPLYSLEFVGKTTTGAGNMSSKYFAEQSKEEQMLKVCTRAIDKSIVQLQRQYDEFKVNVPIYRINEDGTVDVQIGLKEGVNIKSEYDVLMPEEDAEGRIFYTKVGSLRPEKGKIWDNRFGAMEDAEALANDKNAKADEDAEGGNAYLEATTFKVITGGNRIVPGCLVREATIKRVK